MKRAEYLGFANLPGELFRSALTSIGVFTPTKYQLKTTCIVHQQERTNRMYVHIKTFVLRKWLTWSWRLARPNCAVWAGRLETQESQ